MPPPRPRLFHPSFLSIHATRPTPRPRRLRNHARAPFSSTSTSHAAAREPTHYEILDIPVTASAREIKKYVPRLPLFFLRPCTHTPTGKCAPTNKNLHPGNSTPSPKPTIQTATAKTQTHPPASPGSPPPTKPYPTLLPAQSTIATTVSTLTATATVHQQEAIAAIPLQRIKPEAATLVHDLLVGYRNDVVRSVDRRLVFMLMAGMDIASRRVRGTVRGSRKGK